MDQLSLPPLLELPPEGEDNAEPSGSAAPPEALVGALAMIEEPLRAAGLAGEQLQRTAPTAAHLAGQ